MSRRKAEGPDYREAAGDLLHGLLVERYRDGRIVHSTYQGAIGYASILTDRYAEIDHTYNQALYALAYVLKHNELPPRRVSRLNEIHQAQLKERAREE